jgi:hypothetical protein
MYDFLTKKCRGRVNQKAVLYVRSGRVHTFLSTPARLTAFLVYSHPILQNKNVWLKKLQKNKEESII